MNVLILLLAIIIVVYLVQYQKGSVMGIVERFAPVPGANMKSDLLGMEPQGVSYNPNQTTQERPETTDSKTFENGNTLDALNYYNQNFSPDEYLPMEKMCDRKCQITSVLSRDCYANKYNYCAAGNYEMTPNNRMGDSCSGGCLYDPGTSKSNCCLW